MMPAGTRVVDVYACLMKHSVASGQIHQVSQIHVTEGSVGGLAPRRIIELDRGSVLMGIRFARGLGREFGFAAVLRESLLGLHWTSGAEEGTSAWSALTPLTARDEWTGGTDVAVSREHVVAAYEEGSVRPLIQGKIVTRRCPARGGDWSPPQRVCGTASPPLLTCFRNVFYLANLEGASERHLTFDLWSSASGSDWKLVEQWPLPEPPSGASQPIQLAATSDRLLLFEVNTGGRLLAVPLSVSRR